MCTWLRQVFFKNSEKEQGLVMKMAKANENDLRTALDICSALEALEEGFLPNALTDPVSETNELFDPSKHSEMVLDHLLEIASKGSMFRVCFGMAVLLDPRNELVDPDADTLEAHPKFERVRAAAEVAANHLPWHEPSHPDYEGDQSDAGRRLRKAIWPEQYASASE